jgi:hypothetical protein
LGSRRCSELAGSALARRVPWIAAWQAAKFLYGHGRRMLFENLSGSERDRLWQLMQKSRGRPGNLTPRERDRFRELVFKAVRGS